MKKEIVRTSFDLQKSTIEQADLIAHEAKLASRKDAVEWSIGIASQIVEAMKQGLELILSDKDKNRREFNIGSANVQPQEAERMVMFEINEDNTVRLMEILEKPGHPAARVAMVLAKASFRTKTSKAVPANLLHELIYWSLRLDDAEFHCLVCDIITNLITSFDSFQGLVDAEHFQPQFYTNFLEQQFLCDEYQKAKLLQLMP